MEPLPIADLIPPCLLQVLIFFTQFQPCGGSPRYEDSKIASAAANARVLVTRRACRLVSASLQSLPSTLGQQCRRALAHGNEFGPSPLMVFQQQRPFTSEAIWPTRQCEHLAVGLMQKLHEPGPVWLNALFDKGTRTPPDSTIHVKNIVPPPPMVCARVSACTLALRL